MNLRTKQRFERTAKPLILWKNALFYSLKSGTPPDDSGDHPYRPSPRDHSAITSNPLVPTFFLLMVVLLILSSIPTRYWLGAANELPSLAQFFSISRKKQSDILPKTIENVGVWTKKRFGFYYCQDGALYGSKPGELMTQVNALTAGYRPASGQYCTNSKPNGASGESLSFRLRNSVESVENRLPSLDPLLAMVRKKPSAVPKADTSVSVWIKKRFGLYYCQDGALYGSKPGKLMTQAEALMSGYRPAGGQYCANNQSNGPSTSNHSLRAVPETSPKPRATQ